MSHSIFKQVTSQVYGTFNTVLCSLVISLVLYQPTEASPLNGILLAETDSSQSDLTQEQPMGMFAILLKHSEKLFHFEQQQASYTRSWSDLNKLGNACMYNKFKSAEREQVAYFSQKPITVYPPLRLIILKKNTALFPAQIDLANLPIQHQGSIGIVESRSYGDSLNSILSAYPDWFYARSGMNSTHKLLEMLIKNRVLGVIEFSAEVGLIQKKLGLIFDYQAIPIKDVMQPSFGYMACSKTPEGKKLIDNIDLIMATPAFKQAFIEEHNQSFDEDEKALLKPEFDKLL